MTKIISPIIEVPAGAAQTLGHALGLGPIAPSPFAVGPTLARLRRAKIQ